MLDVLGRCCDILSFGCGRMEERTGEGETKTRHDCVGMSVGVAIFFDLGSYLMDFSHFGIGRFFLSEGRRHVGGQ